MDVICSDWFPQGLINSYPSNESKIFSEKPWYVVHLLTLIPIEAILPFAVQTPVSFSLVKESILNFLNESIITFSMFRTNGITFLGSESRIIGYPINCPSP